jgi:putative ABC transport system substrate-binding protein
MALHCVISIAVLSCLICPAADAQELTGIARIGILIPGSEASSKQYVDGLRQGLARSGLVEGKNVAIDYRYAGGAIERLDGMAGELARSNVALIFAGGDQAAAAAKRATDKLPIIAVACDALAAGLINNLSRPEGNLTGVTCINSDLAGKRIEILRETLTQLDGLGVVLNPDDKRMLSELRESERAARVTSTPVYALRVTTPSDIEAAFFAAAANKVSGIVVVFDALTFFHRARLAEIAVSHRMPTIFNFRQYVEAGGLISYGPNLADMYRQSARHIHKVLSGEKPSEIPMEQPTHFELVVNVKTAKALGLQVPQMLLARADEVIE